MTAIRSLRFPFLLFAVAALSAHPATAQQGRPLTFTDLMQIRQIEGPSISPDGAWLAFTAEPDRGDPEVIVREVDGARRYTAGPATAPMVSDDSRWVAARLVPSLEEREETPNGDELKNGMVLFELPGGTVERFEEVRAFAFSADGRFLAYHQYAPESDEESEDAEEAGDREPGTALVLRELGSGTEVTLQDVRAFAFDEAGRWLAYAVAAADNARDGLYVRDLRNGSEHTVDARAFGHYAELTWSEGSPDLAFVMAVEDEDGEPGHGTVMTWDGSGTRETVTGADAPDGWFIPTSTSLHWSEDGARLFFGWRPLRADELEPQEEEPEEAEGAVDEEPFDPYDTDEILEDRGVDVWHWKDPRIMTQQKVLWPREKDRTYTAVWHRDADRVVSLADPEVPDLRTPENARTALATSDVPYRWESTWTGGNDDAYVVDLETGTRTIFAERIDGRPDLSPGGRYVTWYHEGDYHLYDVETGRSRNITEGLGVPIADEDWDYPEPAPGYGVAGWLEGDAAVLLYDKYDIWVVPTEGGAGWSLTEGRGRSETRIFRIVDTDPETEAIGAREELLLSSYHDLRKNFGFYAARADRPGVTRLLEEDKRFRFLAKAEDTDRLLYTREAYAEFPDLWVADTDFSDARKVTDVNPDLTETFAWGSAELVEWESLDGIPLQGVVIKPGNYVEGRRYPVLVYYYRFFSQRLHEFNEPAVNHRPSFPLYASNGYIVFLPDVRFQVGRPGFAATKSVVPGVQRLVELGLADPDRIALHGHSWSGYQTAFMVTQTDIFRTAIAGAPVANMTSAYSGIRLGSGLARQFQYEMSQSRIGGSMWEMLDEYIENSPVFYADRINTPMLILHGDVDDAVPWEQSIEMYLAMRRLGKEAVFLQYRDEPHHPQTYANKLDWSIRMKEWIDHYLKDAPAPAWISEGIPYTGR